MTEPIDDRMGMKQAADFITTKRRRCRDGEGIGEGVGFDRIPPAEAGVECNGRGMAIVLRKGLDEDIEEEEIGLWNGGE